MNDVAIDQSNVLENQSVTGALLNRCPEPIREDLEIVVMLLRERNTAAIEMIARSGLDRFDAAADGSPAVGFPKPEVGTSGSFRESFRVSCTDLDCLMDSLRRENKLSPRLESYVDDLRTQFGALTYYFKIMGLEDVGFQKCLAVLEEMKNSRKYKARIFPNITMMRLVMEKARNFEGAQRVYQYMMNDKYVETKGGEEKLVCKPDAKFFKLWFEVCRRPIDFEVLYKAMKQHGYSELLKFLVEPWGRGLRNFRDYGDFYKYIVGEGLVQSPKEFFMCWLGQVQSSSQLLMVIESVFKSRALDDKLYPEIFMIAGDFSSDSSFMAGLGAIYANADYMDVATSRAGINLYQNLKDNF